MYHCVYVVYTCVYVCMFVYVHACACSFVYIYQCAGYVCVCIPMSVGVHMPHCMCMYVVVTGLPRVSILAFDLETGSPVVCHLHPRQPGLGASRFLSLPFVLLWTQNSHTLPMCSLTEALGAWLSAAGWVVFQPYILFLSKAAFITWWWKPFSL